MNSITLNLEEYCRGYDLKFGACRFTGVNCTTAKVVGLYNGKLVRRDRRFAEDCLKREEAKDLEEKIKSVAFYLALWLRYRDYRMISEQHKS